MKFFRRTIVMALTISLCFLFTASCSETGSIERFSTEYLVLAPIEEETEEILVSKSESELDNETDNQSDLPSEDDSEVIEVEKEYIPFEPENSSEAIETGNTDKLENEEEATVEETVINTDDSEPQYETVSYTIDSINKTVYTTANVNVRLGPSDDFDVIGSFQEDMEVAVTGVCEETGWYQTSFSSTDAYFDAQYAIEIDAVTSAQPKNETATDTESVSVAPLNQSSQQNNGDYVSGGFPLWNYNWHSGVYLGRLRIPSVGVNVAIYNNNSQTTIDAWDSAMFCYEYDREDGVYSSDNTIYCADHNNQGFVAIANCCLGCYMYIDGVDGNTYRYVCDKIDYNGINTGWGLNDSTGHSVNRDGGVWCYTCHDDSEYYIYMVHFSPV